MLMHYLPHLFQNQIHTIINSFFANVVPGYQQYHVDNGCWVGVC